MDLGLNLEESGTIPVDATLNGTKAADESYTEIPLAM